jgi:hypothetical protein
MSRYLKDVSAVKYRFKKFFNQAGLYSIQIPNPVSLLNGRLRMK